MCVKVHLTESEAVTYINAIEKTLKKYKKDAERSVHLSQLNRLCGVLEGSLYLVNRKSTS